MDFDATATPQPIAEMERLGDEIAELFAHLEAVGAHLLDLIREFDARFDGSVGMPMKFGAGPEAGRFCCLRRRG